MKALGDQITNHISYHKLQGFIYDQLINATTFKDIHDKSSYKFFNYSNIFPPSISKVDEKRYLLFASPNYQLVESVLEIIKQLAESKTIINIGDNRYRLISARMFKLKINNNKICIIRTSTPITIRISENSYSKFHIPPYIRKDNFLYWRDNLPTDIFVKSIENNMQKKYELFYQTKLENTFPLIEEFIYLKQVILHIPVEELTLKIPASFWKFYCNTNKSISRKLLHFILDSGIGERNSFGLGFMNVEDGAEIVEISRISIEE
jgi:CRISPR-associated endoribonuclease Cas6